MTKLKFIRAGGLLMIVSGLTLGYSYISHPQQMTPEVIASANWIFIHMLFALSITLGLLGTTALYAVTAQRGGMLGLVGHCLLVVGMMMISGLDYYEFLIAPFLAVNYPAVIVDHRPGDAMGWVAMAFPAAGLLTVIGHAVLGLACKRALVLPAGITGGLILSSIAFGVGLSPVSDIMVARGTASFFGAALVAVGV